MHNKSPQPSATEPGQHENPRGPSKQRDTQPNDLQPAATGANRGSPAAPVMKQFSKTEAEGTGHPDKSKKSSR